VLIANHDGIIQLVLQLVKLLITLISPATGVFEWRVIPVTACPRSCSYTRYSKHTFFRQPNLGIGFRCDLIHYSTQGDSHAVPRPNILLHSVLLDMW
jgi:hypothetical protein